ncbi:MAG: Na+/H+ antiporter subunit B [Planctomycetaceae bacterium]
MPSLILKTATRFLQPLLLFFSLFLLVRGHNEPGGGFVGGLLAAAAFALYAIAESPAAARRALRIDPHLLIGGGLLLASTSGILGLTAGRPFLSGEWGLLPIAGLGAVPLGTPVLFDVGVYLVVVGTTLLMIFSLAEQE